MALRDLQEAMAWGLVPKWITRHVNTYSSMGLKQYSNTSITFPDGTTYDYWSRESWNNLSPATQAKLGHDFISQNKDLYLGFKSIRIDQPVGAVDFGTPIVTSNLQNALEPGNTGVASITIDNETSSSSMTTDYTLKISKNASSSSTTARGWFNSSSIIPINIGNIVSAKLSEALGDDVNVDNYVTDNTTIDSASTHTEGKKSNIEQTFHTTIKTPPHTKSRIFITYTQQNITLPWLSPIFPHGFSMVRSSMGGVPVFKNNIISYKGQQLPTLALEYYYPHFGPEQIDGEAAFMSDGKIDNINGWSYKATLRSDSKPVLRSSIKSEKFASKLVSDTSATSEELNLSPQKPTTFGIDGVDTEVGLYFPAEDSMLENGFFIGTNKCDYIQMNGRNQTAHTFGGDDIVEGSIYSDTIVSTTPSDIGDTIRSKEGDDNITGLNGSHCINAGSGNDTIYISADNGGLVDDITLGEGSDKLTIDLSQNTSETAFIIRDLSLNDNLIFEGGSLQPVIVGSSVELFSEGRHIGTLLDYVAQFDELTGTSNAEIGFLNMDILANDSSSDTSRDWMNLLIESSALGTKLNTNYQELAGQREAFKDNILSLQKYAYDGVDSKLTQWGLDNRYNFDSATAFATEFFTHIHKPFSKQPYISGDTLISAYIDPIA